MFSDIIENLLGDPSDSGSVSPWIGLRKVNGAFVWLDGKTANFSRYEKNEYTCATMGEKQIENRDEVGFNLDEPNNEGQGSNEDCVIFNRPKPKHWCPNSANDWLCNMKASGVLCEKPLI